MVQVHYHLVQPKRTTEIQFTMICHGSEMTSPCFQQLGWVFHLLCKWSTWGSHCAAPTFIPPGGKPHQAHNQDAHESITRLQIHMEIRFAPRILLAYYTTTVMLPTCSVLQRLFRMPSSNWLSTTAWQEDGARRGLIDSIILWFLRAMILDITIVQ